VSGATPPGRAFVPPGWPAEVPPPGAAGWERRATGWLFDLCPADLRAHEVLHRQPVVLAYLAERHVDAALLATTEAVATLRADLRGVVEPEALAQSLDALQREQARLEAAARSVGLVAEALRGVRFRPRL
jgi:hypothetical protein